MTCKGVNMSWYTLSRPNVEVNKDFHFSTALLSFLYSSFSLTVLHLCGFIECKSQSCYVSLKTKCACKARPCSLSVSNQDSSSRTVSIFRNRSQKPEQQIFCVCELQQSALLSINIISCA